MKHSIHTVVIIAALLIPASCKSSPGGTDTAASAQPADLDTMRQESYLELLRQGAAAPFAGLLDDGAVDIEWRDKDGSGYLHHAVWHNQPEIAAALVQAGADVDARRKDGYRPLHWAAYKGDTETCRLLLEAGADVDALGSGTTALYWAVAHRQSEAANLLLGWGADAALADSGFPSALSWAAEELDPKLSDYYRRYGSTALAAALGSPEAFDRGKPDFPPRAKAELTFIGTAAYLDRALISVEASNVGNGALYELVGSITVDGRDLPHRMYFGKLEPDQSARRTLAFTDIRYTDTGTELPFTITFTEANHYDPPPLLGKLAILKADPAFIIDHITSLDNTELQHFLDRGFILPIDICRAVLLRASDLGMAKVINLLDENGLNKTVVEELARTDNLPYRVNNIIIEDFMGMSNSQLRFFLDREYVAATDIYQAVLRRASELGMVRIKGLLEDNLIDKNVVDKLIHFDKLPYDIDDLIYFADKEAITREYLELALLDGRVEFDVSHLVELGRKGAISRQVAEAFYANGKPFSRDQIQALGRLDLFTLPEVLYTYTIDDGDSGKSSGNGDGMIQIREGVDFHFTIKNASRYDLDDVQIVLQQSADGVDLFSDPKNLAVFKMDDTISMDATIGMKSSFKGSTLPMRVLVKSPQFGTMLDEKIDVPVGQTVGSPVLALNKQVSARDSIIVRSGASDKSPRIASLARGAVFTAVGELEGWYKVGVYGAAAGFKSRRPWTTASRRNRPFWWKT